MIEAKFFNGCICLLLSVSMYGQNGNINALDNAQLEYERGNYERSLSYLNASTGVAFNDKALTIKNFWLTVENYIELQYPEEVIIENLKSILTMDPLFTEEKYNLDFSGSLASRMQTISVYPQWVLNVRASRDFIFPFVVKEPYICEECVESDNYSFSEMGSNLNFNLGYFYTRKLGVESGIGYTTFNYSRNINGISQGDKYTLAYNEKLQLIDVPLYYVIALTKWNIRVGANYKYLIQSDAKIFHSFTDKIEEEITQQFTRDNLQEIRNNNLIFFGFHIDREIFPSKDKSLWYLTLNFISQVSLNSFISEKHRLSDLGFISDTYYTDDKVNFAMFGLGLRFNYNAKYKIIQ